MEGYDFPLAVKSPYGDVLNYISFDQIQADKIRVGEHIENKNYPGNGNFPLQYEYPDGKRANFVCVLYREKPIILERGIKPHCYPARPDNKVFESPNYNFKLMYGIDDSIPENKAIIQGMDRVFDHQKKFFSSKSDLEKIAKKKKFKSLYQDPDEETIREKGLKPMKMLYTDCYSVKGKDDKYKTVTTLFYTPDGKPVHLRDLRNQRLELIPFFHIRSYSYTNNGGGSISPKMMLVKAMIISHSMPGTLFSDQEAELRKKFLTSSSSVGASAAAPVQEEEDDHDDINTQITRSLQQEDPESDEEEEEEAPPPEPVKKGRGGKKRSD